MWESAKTIAPTPNSVIVRPEVDDKFVINSTHLNMIQENKFDGYLRADPHDHIYKYLCLLDLELLDDELEKEEFIGLYWLINNKPELGRLDLFGHLQKLVLPYLPSASAGTIAVPTADLEDTKLALPETVLAIISRGRFSLGCLLTIDPLLSIKLEGQNGFLGTDKKRCHNRLNKGRTDLEYLKQVQEELLSMKSGNYVDDGSQELNYVVSIYNALKKKWVEWVKIRLNLFPMRKL
ncbi:hypothetical protein Tco_0169829 [Tanacetum coccineum]